jgi:protein CpxP
MKLAGITATLVIAAAALLTTAPASARPDGGMGMHGGIGGGMGLPMHPGHLERLLEGVNASAEQKTQIRGILQTLRSDMKAQRQGGQGLHEQAGQVFSAPNVDARAVEALRQQMLARHDAASKRTMQAMIDVARVLSPEQRNKLFEQLKQRRGMMERHRAERESVEGGAPKR